MTCGGGGGGDGDGFAYSSFASLSAALACLVMIHLCIGGCEAKDIFVSK